MILDLEDDQWVTVLLALRKGETGRRVLRIEDQTACGDVLRVIRTAIGDVERLDRMAHAVASCVAVRPEPDPEPEPEEPLETPLDVFVDLLFD